MAAKRKTAPAPSAPPPRALPQEASRRRPAGEEFTVVEDYAAIALDLGVTPDADGKFLDLIAWSGSDTVDPDGLRRLSGRRRG